MRKKPLYIYIKKPLYIYIKLCTMLYHLHIAQQQTFPNVNTLSNNHLFLLFNNLVMIFLINNLACKSPFDGSLVKNPTANTGDVGQIPGLRRSPGGGIGNPSRYSFQGKSHGQRNLVGYSSYGRKELDKTEQLNTVQPEVILVVPLVSVLFLMCLLNIVSLQSASRCNLPVG